MTHDEYHDGCGCTFCNNIRERQLMALYAKRDPRTPELIERFERAVAAQRAKAQRIITKQRCKEFWAALEASPAPASPGSVVQNLMRTSKRRRTR
jgi:hypothetical protein